MEDNLDEKIKPIKVENESGFTQTGNTCDMPNNRVHDTSAIIKSEPDSNCEDDDGVSKSVTKVIEETSKEEPNCETEERRMTRSMRNRMMTQNKQDSSKSVGPAKISYCEDSSSADSEDEYLSPKKKRTKVSAKSKSLKASTGPGGKSNSRGQEKTEIPSSVSVIKQEDSSGETKDSLSNFSENINVIRDAPVKGMKAKVVKKHSIDIGEIIIEKMTFQDVCEIFQTKYHFKKFYRQNPEVIAACRNVCKKYLIYRCKICMSDSGNMDCAKDHFDKKHSGDQKKNKNKDIFVEYFNELYKCYQCGFKTLYIRNLVKHVNSFHSHDKQELHSCDKCKFTTFDKYRFSSHVENHLRPEKQKTECHVCHASVVRIKKHLKNMHAENSGEIKCPLCPSIFGNVPKMRRHLKNIHARQGNNFVCKVCGKVCHNEIAFGRHTRTHYQTGKRFECKLCSIKLSSKSSLYLHMRLHRSDVKSLLYACAYCEKSFSMKQYLQNHIRREHDKTCEEPEKNHLCEICGKSFVLKSGLEKHMVVHTKVKEFVCAICNKAFTEMGSLKTHQVVHTGIYPFECGECGNKYSKKYPLTQHIKKHHPN